jgi:hypothetical protein
MEAFVGFERAISRVDRLLALHGELHGSRGRPAQHIADILRASLVLTVAALDAFVYEAVVEAVPALARQGRLGAKADRIADAKELLAAIATDDPADALRHLARDKFSRTTLQKAAAIEGHLRDTLGYTIDWSAVATNLAVGSDGAAREQLDGYVLRRDRIAHAGDVQAGKRQATAINRPYVQQGRDTVFVVGTTINSGLDAHI